jgi:amidohydrolase
VDGVTELKARIVTEVEKLHARLVDISHTLHDNPETLFQEKRAAALLTGVLEESGFTVERGTAGLETAFVATHGYGRPAVAFLAEYDALPKLGHGCGHNMIATWAVGAAIALRRTLPAASGMIQVIGTPAEEGGGGKVTMADAGVFRGLDAAIMMHPRDTTYLDRGSLAVIGYDLEFFGKSAHASAQPERGINALDAVLQVFFSVNAMRQSMRPHTRVHGNITHGGDAPNVIPDYAAAKFLLRAREQAHLDELRDRFLKIVDAAALATGARSNVKAGLCYQQRVSNLALIETFRDNLTALGHTHEVPPPDAGVGSSDVGNVSQLVPAIHPYLKICEAGIGGHTPEFAAAARSARADELLKDGSVVLAWTGADVLLRSDVRERIGESFRAQLGRDPQE